MTPAEVFGLLAALKAAFPRFPVSEETAALYARQLEDLDYTVAKRAVEEIVRTSPRFPSIAELREEYKRFWVSRPRQRELEPPRLSDAERQQFAELMRNTLQQIGVGPTVTPEKITAGLEEDVAGRCDDCAEIVRLRWKYGRFVLCVGCVGSRRTAASKVQAA